MNRFILLIPVFLAGCGAGYDAMVECYSTDQFKKQSSPSFQSYVMNVQSNGQSRADVYIQMPYNHLRFEKTTEGFKGSYTMAFILRTHQQIIAQTKEVDRSIMVQTYDETVSPRFDFHFQSFVIPPGTYTLEMVVTDNLSHLKYHDRSKFTAIDFSTTDPSASSILYLDTLVTDERGIALRPVLPSSFSQLDESVGMFQELYHLLPGDTIGIAVSYFRPLELKREKKDFSFLLPPYRSTADKCGEPYDSLYFRKDSTLVASRLGTLQVFQFYPLPLSGSTHITRTLTFRRNGSTDSITIGRNVFCREKRYRSTLSYEEIIAAMRYIVREEEYDSLVTGTGLDRNRRLIQFWDRRGGDEQRREFERRVVEANSLFTTCVDGSQTAMGIVYIVCGIPDAVDCRGSFDETWLYTIGDRAFSLQFRRENEQIQNYELIPFSVSDTLWQYFVNRWRRIQ